MLDVLSHMNTFGTSKESHWKWAEKTKDEEGGGADIFGFWWWGESCMVEKPLDSNERKKQQTHWQKVVRAQWLGFPCLPSSILLPSSPFRHCYAILLANSSSSCAPATVLLFIRGDLQAWPQTNSDPKQVPPHSLTNSSSSGGGGGGGGAGKTITPKWKNTLVLDSMLIDNSSWTTI